MSAPPGDEDDAPAFTGYEGVVEPGWIDDNGHMNVAWYDHVFDIAEEALYDAFGINVDYIRTRRHGMFRLEKTLRYERELMEGDRIMVASRIAFTDERLVRQHHELMNLTRGGRAAFADYLSIHVDLTRRRATPIADADIRARLAGFIADHGGRDVASEDR